MTQLEPLRAYLLSWPEATEELPFGPQVLVYKVAGKMFALVAIDQQPLRLNLKCDPEQALHLRAYYAAVLPGYHMNKRHWNSLLLDGSIPEAELRQMIDDSWRLVVAGLPKRERQRLGTRRRDSGKEATDGNR